MMNDQMTAAVLRGKRGASAYQPKLGTDDEGMDDYRSTLETRKAMSRLERLAIRDVFNANVGRANARRGVCEKYGVGRMNEAGRDLIDGVRSTV